jgi:hypothetical protein
MTRVEPVLIRKLDPQQRMIFAQRVRSVKLTAVYVQLAQEIRREPGRFPHY